MKNILEKAKINHNLNKDEIIKLLSSNDLSLFYSADEVRKKYKGNSIHIRGLVEHSNICKRNCYYCGLRCENKEIKRYRLTSEEIKECGQYAVELGYKTIVLQSGEDDYFDADKICKIIKELKKYNLAVTLSIGERTFEEYKAFKDSGADRYLLRIETTDETLYKQLHPNMSFKNRLKCLKDLKQLGYETGTGCLVGLPNQTIESLANDILFFKELNADMIGIGPFIPHPNTPLANHKINNFNLSIRVMAITRLLLPDINIPATTAMETLNKNGHIIALQSGANVLMLNITPQTYKKNYEIYPDKAGINNNEDENKKLIYDKIKSINRSISNSYGFRQD